MSSQTFEMVATLYPRKFELAATSIPLIFELVVTENAENVACRKGRASRVVQINCRLAILERKVTLI